MPWYENLALGIIATLIGTLVVWCWLHRGHVLVAAQAVTVYRSRRFRISVASLLCLTDGTGKHILFRMAPTRSEAFGPPGGVRKYFPTAEADLQRFEWDPEFPLGSGGEHDADLRGRVPGHKVPGLLRWLAETSDIENNTDALRRELGEETADVGVKIAKGDLNGLRLREVRHVLEYQRKAPRAQIRLISVLAPIEGDASTQALTAAVKAGLGANVIAVTTEDMRAGRTRSGEAIASSAEYLFSSFKRREDLAPFRP
jgi:hypothetical protein